jgi:tellurite resistance protein TehA-like permease
LRILDRRAGQTIHGRQFATGHAHDIQTSGHTGIILGLTGLGGCWRVAAGLWHLPKMIGEAVMLAATANWVVLILLYVAKWIWRKADALAEFRHPVACCFIGLVPVSNALIGIAVRPYVPEIATILAFVGIVSQLCFGVYRTGQLWMGGRDPATTTPVLYLPTVAGSSSAPSCSARSATSIGPYHFSARTCCHGWRWNPC